MGHRSTGTGRKLLVGIDFSESCERALMHAVALAEPQQADVELVHVFEWRQPADGCDTALRQAVTTQARALIGRLNALCSARVADRVSAGTRVLIGDPATELAAEAQRIGASLIVLGAVGRSAVAGRPMGATAQRLRATSPLPVLLVGGTDGAPRVAPRPEAPTGLPRRSLSAAPNGLSLAAE